MVSSFLIPFKYLVLRSIDFVYDVRSARDDMIPPKMNQSFSPDVGRRLGLDLVSTVNSKDPAGPWCSIVATNFLKIT